MPDGRSLTYILLFFVLLFFCAYFSCTETAFSSLNRVHMITLADSGKKSAKRVLYILDNFDKALSTLLVGNNIVNIGCATIVTLLAAKICRDEDVAVALATAVTTVTLFLFAEMVPKCYGRACNEKVALASSLSLIFFMKLLTPLSAVFGFIGGLVARIFSDGKEKEPTVTEDELVDIALNMSEENGEIDEDTALLIKSAVDFTYRTAGEILVPWADVQKISSNMKSGEIAEIIKDCTHSRLPVIDRHGNIKGVLQIRKFLKSYIKQSGRVVLASVTDRPFFTEKDIPIDELLEKLSNSRKNMAVIRETDGSILGIVTVEDILEELVGEIYDEEDKEENV